MRISDWSSDVCSSDLANPDDRMSHWRLVCLALGGIGYEKHVARHRTDALARGAADQGFIDHAAAMGAHQSEMAPGVLGIVSEQRLGHALFKDRNSQRTNSRHYCASPLPSSSYYKT